MGERSRAYYKHYGYPTRQLFFSPQCVDAEWFASHATPARGRALRSCLGIGTEENAVLFAGKLIPLKRSIDVIEACATHGLSGTHLIVAGSGQLEGAMRERADSLGVKLHLLGFQNQTEMPGVYAAADALILPSSQETWGLVANEALACGTPIVVSDAVGCAPDLAADQTAGRTFPVADTAALSRAIKEILTSPPPPEAIAAKSNGYTVDAAVDGIERAMAAIARNGLRQRTPAQVTK